MSMTVWLAGWLACSIYLGKQTNCISVIDGYLGEKNVPAFMTEIEDRAMREAKNK